MIRRQPKRGRAPFADAPPQLRRAVAAIVGHVERDRDAALPAEAALATGAGVSRATLRRAVDALVGRGLLKRADDGTRAVRAPRAADRPPVDDAPASRREAFTAFFFAKLARGELRPGDAFSELELAREAGLNTVPVREALLTIAHSGMVAKQPRRRWTVVRLDQPMIDELFQFRELIEQTAVRAAAALPATAQLRADFATLLREHHALARAPRLAAFLALDERFHRTLLTSTANRYLVQQFATISTLIRFQLQTSAVGERGMRLGLAEHPRVLRAVLDGDAAAATVAMRAHLASARGVTLLAAMGALR